MKRFSLIIQFTLISIWIIGQKPALDSTHFSNWPLLKTVQVADNGESVAFLQSRSRNSEDHLLVVKKLNTDWKKEINVKGLFFAFFNQSQTLVFIKSKDSIGLLSIDDDRLDYIKGAKFFKLPGNTRSPYIAFALNGPEQKLIIKRFTDNKEWQYNNIRSYIWNKEGTRLALLKEEINSGNKTQTLSFWDAANGNEVLIWKGSQASMIVFDRKGEQIAFWVKSDSSQFKELWKYKAGSNKPEKILDERNVKLPDDLALGEDLLKFSYDAARLYIHLKSKPNTSPANGAQVDVWSYIDAKLQAQQLQEPAINSYLSVVNMSNGEIVRLQQENDYTFRFLNTDYWDSLLVYTNIQGDPYSRERNWNNLDKPALYLVSTINGSRKLLTPASRMVELAAPTQDGRWIIYYSPVDKNYFSYEIATDITRNITSNINTIWTNYESRDMPDSMFMPRSLAGWIKGKGVLIHDQFDIWLVDPFARNLPINLTNGYGKKHQLFLQAIEGADKVYGETDTIVLSAFDKISKNNGFFALPLKKYPQDPQVLTMGPFHYDLLQMPTLKAKDRNVFVVRRQSSAQYPNYYITNDFKTFRQISFLDPERSVNWYKTELLTWKDSDGSKLEGVLYKPENFDSTKKYPIIFYYYERLSHRLNNYLTPEEAEGSINIPYFVSNSYLIFTPDIHYKIGEPLESARKTIVSGANYLKKFPWVDGKNMGLQGHSWGGFQTIYIIAHSNMFAAGLAAAGAVNMISDYNNVNAEGICEQHFFESNQLRLGTTIWKDPNIYIKNSSIFDADKITTPILLMNNKADAAVPFAQGLELFNSLRRLGKKVWLLQYDDQGHILVDEKAKRDYTIRTFQFFNHYLKGVPAPSWMTFGVPAKLKGRDGRFNFDEKIREPGVGLDKK